jgi:predicted nucleotidyltransferase
LEQYGNAAPIEFEKLLHLIGENPVLLADIRALLVKKRAAPEMGLEPPVPSIHSFIEDELERLEKISPSKSYQASVVGSLSDVFRSCLSQAWA